MHIRDPIHGAIEITPAEQNVIDSRYFQRLRNIKQLGFADLAFPGATHSRYAHGIGAMSVASRLFDAIYRDLAIDPKDCRRLRSTLRLAVLLHDLGHPPLSHTSELILPPRRALGLPAWTNDGEPEQASHEDMTLLFLLNSGLAEAIREGFKDEGISPEHVASLLCGRRPPGEDPFRLCGVDHAPLLRQIVSSELDADRMDYLLRDSFYTGVHYGRYDLDWITQNVAAVAQDDAYYLGIGHRAVFAFEDFLLSRYHMFLAVYYHYTSINFEKLLAKYYETAAGEFHLDPDPEKYAEADDIQLLVALRSSHNPWARRIVERRGFRLLVEVNPFEQEVDAQPLIEALEGEGIGHFVAESHGVLSKYLHHEDGGTSIFARTTRGEWRRIEHYTPLFRRYADAARLLRVYVEPEQFDRARTLAGPLARR